MDLLPLRDVPTVVVRREAIALEARPKGAAETARREVVPNSYELASNKALHYRSLR